MKPQCAVNSTLSSPHTQTQSCGASGLVYKGYIRPGKVQSVRVCQHGHIYFTLSILLNLTSYYMFRMIYNNIVHCWTSLMPISCVDWYNSIQYYNYNTTYCHTIMNHCICLCHALTWQTLSPFFQNGVSQHYITVTSSNHFHW